MTGICDTTIVTDYYDNFMGIVHRKGKLLPIAQVVTMALDAARGLQVRLCYLS